MQYALDRFMLTNATPVLVQGSNSLYTYQNIGSAVAQIQGSNDAIHWIDISAIAAGTSLVREHSYKYLRAIGSTQVIVNRGEGNNTNDGETGSGGNVDLSGYYTKNEVDDLIDNIDVGSGGGGSYDFSVADLTLADYKTEVASVIQLTPDKSNTLTGTASVGTVTADTEGYLAWYFSFGSGSFDITLDADNTTALTTIVQAQPTEAYNLNISAPADPTVLIMYSSGYIQLMFIGSGMQAIYSVAATNPSETITIKRTGTTLEAYHAGVLLGNCTYPALGEYVQAANAIGAIPVAKTTFDISNVKLVSYNLPNSVKDGNIYHLQDSATLLGKTVNVGDYIQFYADKTDFIVTRVVEKPHEYFKGIFTSESQLTSLTDKFNDGDYALVITANSSDLYFYSTAKHWSNTKAAPFDRYKGTFEEVPTLTGSTAGDYILVGTSGNLRTAFFNPVLNTFTSTTLTSDEVSEGSSNLYYTDQRAASLVTSLFANNLNENYVPNLKFYFDRYVQALIDTTLTSSEENVVYVPNIKDRRVLTVSNSAFVTPDLSPRFTYLEWESGDTLGNGVSMFPVSTSSTGDICTWYVPAYQRANNTFEYTLQSFFALKNLGDSELNGTLKFGICAESNLPTQFNSIYFNITATNGYIAYTFKEKDLDPISVTSPTLIYHDNKYYVPTATGVVEVAKSFSRLNLYYMYLFVEKLDTDVIGLSAIDFDLKTKFTLPA